MAVRAKTLAGPILIALLILVCAVILMMAYALWPTPTRSIMATQRLSTQPATIERGRCLAPARDCAGRSRSRPLSSRSRGLRGLPYEGSRRGFRRRVGHRVADRDDLQHQHHA